VNKVTSMIGYDDPSTSLSTAASVVFQEVNVSAGDCAAMSRVASSGEASSTSRISGSSGREASTSVKRSLGPSVRTTSAASSCAR
jgi:hypothetical protein